MCNHIAIIPDGNRRWAAAHNLPSFEGHRRGFDVAVNLAKQIRQMGVHTLTIWAFSTENWNRTKDEVSYLMGLYELLISRCLTDAMEDEVRVFHLGRRDRIPASLLKKIEKAEKDTKHFDKYSLNIALDYGGQDEMERMMQKLQISKTPITKEEIEKNLDTENQPHPNPDIVIRTSGEIRTSGFMIWQSAYSEWFFLKKHFPDLNIDDIKQAVEEYNLRQRRFGK